MNVGLIIVILRGVGRTFSVGVPIPSSKSLMRGSGGVAPGAEKVRFYNYYGLLKNLFQHILILYSIF